MNELALVVFDMAGTVVKDRGEVPASFTYALEAHGLSVSSEDLAAVRGSSKREAIRRLVADQPEPALLAGRVYASFRERLMERFRERGVEAIDGAEAVFAWLRSRGVGVALNTGFERDITEALVRALKWDGGVVDAIVCGDDVRAGRPAPYLIFHAMEATGAADVRTVANVGDTLLDLTAGANAGVRWNVGVLTGAHGRRVLERAPHTHLIPSVASLPDLWRSL
jgi:phosphonatase-like hydrolase